MGRNNKGGKMKHNENIIENYDDISIENPLRLWIDKIGDCGKSCDCKDCSEFHKCRIRTGEKQ